MSIQSEIQRISGNISASLQAVARKGVAVPGGAGSGELPGLIEQIQQGEGPAVLEEKTIKANGVYTPGPGVDGFGKVTVDVPQSGGDPFSVAWGTVLPDQVVENQLFIMYRCDPDDPYFNSPPQAVMVGEANVLPSDPKWGSISGLWFKKILDPEFSWGSSGSFWTLETYWLAGSNDGSEHNISVVLGSEALVTCAIEIYAAAQIYAETGEFSFVPVYWGKNGVWEVAYSVESD